ncbi:DNA cytosine methyltransferase [Kutzneria buriramensis]|uniref:DNA (Cytosine-5)-methyltransferase 1 n=1 Tax=Kutzneria buriramensis TaxID=1045776 RepID=A0A3E0GUY0_9PSEU|nr:DNA cytosine methyltransferase [Kutzneria buriramensis]REH26010.1 DNA (cytosine-5)-methyltransferase 1 [Kutzneria buriramensis]
MTAAAELNKAKPRHGSLFTGTGALDMAVTQVFGTTPAWHCDNDPAVTQLLTIRCPYTPNLGDIRTVDWSTVAQVTIATTGFPCTDVSSAGKQAGLTPDTSSGLWFHTAHAIDRLRPQLVVFENVRGLLSANAVRPVGRDGLDPSRSRPLRALGAVLGDLADLGYDASWVGLPASDLGTAHRRFRIIGIAWPTGDPGFVAAHADRTRRLRTRRTRHGLPHHHRPPAGRDHPPAAHRDRADDIGIDWGRYAPAIRRWEHALGRPAPAPAVPGRSGRPRLNPVFMEWLMGLPDGWVTDVPGLTDDDKRRVLGNGVVPRQAVAALHWLLDTVPTPASVPVAA